LTTWGTVRFSEGTVLQAASLLVGDSWRSWQHISLYSTEWHNELQECGRRRSWRTVRHAYCDSISLEVLPCGQWRSVLSTHWHVTTLHWHNRWSIGKMIVTREDRSALRNTCHIATLPHISHGLTRNRRKAGVANNSVHTVCIHTHGLAQVRSPCRVVSATESSALQLPA
jgi:hypothetical protein